MSASAEQIDLWEVTSRSLSGEQQLIRISRAGQPLGEEEARHFVAELCNRGKIIFDAEHRPLSREFYVAGRKECARGIEDLVWKLIWDYLQRPDAQILTVDFRPRSRRRVSQQSN